MFKVVNITNNPIYSLKIVLTAENRRTVYSFHGLKSGESMVLIPNKFLKRWGSLFIKFRTSANEIGYMYCSMVKGTKYYFVKGRNDMVNVSGDDVMISENDEIAQKFKQLYYDAPVSTGYFYAKNEIGEF